MIKIVLCVKAIIITIMISLDETIISIKHDRRNYCFQGSRHRKHFVTPVNIIVPVNGIPTLNINLFCNLPQPPNSDKNKETSFHFVSKHCPTCKPCLLENIAYQKIMYLPVGFSVIYFPIDAWEEFTLCNIC